MRFAISNMGGNYIEAIILNRMRHAITLYGTILCSDCKFFRSTGSTGSLGGRIGRAVT